jgi:putative transposase
MGRPRRSLPAGTIAHIVNRSVDRRTIFHNRLDYQAFTNLLEEGRDKAWVDILGYCLMPNHWHLIVRALADNSISRYMKWLTATHVLRYRNYHRNLGNGHLYQGRFRAVVITDDEHFLTALRYVEANAGRAGLATWAEGWEWSSGFERRHRPGHIVGELPVALPPNWCRLLNQDSPDLPEPVGENDLPGRKPR